MRAHVAPTTLRDAAVAAARNDPNGCPDVYFTADYGQADAAHVGAEWALMGKNDWQMPLLRRPLDKGWSDALSPYGYSGIYTSLSADEAVGRWTDTLAQLRDGQVVSVFLRMSPLDPVSTEMAAGYEGLETAQSGSTFVVQTVDAEASWWALEGRARTAIRKAHKSNLHATIRRVEPPDVEQGSPFRQLYESTMHRIGASRRYFFGPDYYRSLVDGLGDELYLSEVYDSSEVVASSLVLRHGPFAHYHLSGSDPQAARLGASALLVWKIIEWACESSGVMFTHLGGGVEEGDGLDRFKRSFGGTRKPFVVGKVIVNPERYARLTAERAEHQGVSPAQLRESTFFPAYRAESR